MQTSMNDASISRQLVLHARFQSVCAAITALCMLLVLVGALCIAPRMLALTEKAQHMIDKSEALIEQTEVITHKLAQMDLEAMVENVDGLVDVSRAGIEEAIAQIAALDIETLNSAIANLSDVIEPLSNFFRLLKR